MRDLDPFMARLQSHMQRASNVMPSLAEQIEGARRMGLPDAFLAEADALFKQFCGNPGDGANAVIRDAPRDIASTRAFLARWEANSNTPGYDGVVKCLRLILSELQALEDVLGEMTPEERAYNERLNRVSHGLMGGSCLKTLVIVAVVAFVVTMIVRHMMH